MIKQKISWFSKDYLSQYIKLLQLNKKQSQKIENKIKEKEELQLSADEIFKKFLKPVDIEGESIEDLFKGPYVQAIKEQIEQSKRNTIQYAQSHIDYSRQPQTIWLIDGVQKSVQELNGKHFKNLKNYKEQIYSQLQEDNDEQTNQKIRVVLNSIDLSPQDLEHDKSLPYQFVIKYKGLTPESNQEEYIWFFKENCSDAGFRMITTIEKTLEEDQEQFDFDKRVKIEYDEYLDSVNNSYDHEKEEQERRTIIEQIKQINQIKEHPNEIGVFGTYSDRITYENFPKTLIKTWLPNKMRPEMHLFPHYPVSSHYNEYVEYISFYSVIASANYLAQVLWDMDEIAQEIEEHYKEDFERMNWEGYPTIMAYYHLLPDEIQKKPNVMALAVLLEKNAAWVPLQQKQQALNQAAHNVMPYTEQTDIYMKGMYWSQFKYQPTMSDYINIDMIGDDGESINSVKRQWLMNIKPEEEFDQPDVNMDPYYIEDTLPINPIDYYDNEDGFWDEFIKKKREKYSKIKIYPNRCFFMH